MSFLSEQEKTNRLLNIVIWLLVINILCFSMNLFVGVRVCHIWNTTFEYMKPIPNEVNWLSGKLSPETKALIKKEYKSGHLERYLKPLSPEMQTAIRKMISRNEI